MARPRKHGIEYFPFDLDFFEDDKIQYAQAVGGPECVVSFLRLLCALYRKGICWRWGKVEMVAFAAQMGSDGRTCESWTQTWLECGLFDADVYQNTGFLTSKAIQKRYFEICKVRAEVRMPEGVLCVPENELPDGVTISFINLKVKVKVKGNPEFPSVFSNKTKEKPQETPNPPEAKEKPKPKTKFDPTGKHQFGQNVYLDDKQIARVERYFLKNGLDADDLQEAIGFLDSWFENNPNKRKNYKDDASILIGWPFEKVVERKRKKMALERQQSFNIEQRRAR